MMARRRTVLQLQNVQEMLEKRKETKKVFGLQFSLQNLDALADRLTSESPAPDAPAHLVFTLNLDHVVQLSKTNTAFRKAYDSAQTVTADGMPVYIYARLRGVPLPGRTPGADLLPALLERLAPERHRPFFITSDSTTASRLKGLLMERGFGDRAVSMEVPPYGFEKDETYSSELAQRIRDHNTTHLIFGVGAPKSEIWLDRHRAAIGPCYALSLGASANFLVGTATRAPRWMRFGGLEWFWRFCCEPRRLFRRYFIDSWRFLKAVKDDLKIGQPLRSVE
jgi:N-acetylglucosaminyldiphosphoundecaprenol N-acetyl-beta-D-mannosaminyltransferase